MIDVNAVKSARVRAGLNQSEIAEKIGISVGSYCAKENGRVDFKASEIEVFCDVCGIETADEKCAIFFA